MVLVMLGGSAFPHFPKPGWHSNEYQNRRRVFLETEWCAAALTKLLPSASALFNRAWNERASAFGPASLGRRVIGEDADFTCFAYAPAVLARRQLKPFLGSICPQTTKSKSGPLKPKARRLGSGDFRQEARNFPPRFCLFLSLVRSHPPPAAHENRGPRHPRGGRTL